MIRRTIRYYSACKIVLSGSICLIFLSSTGIGTLVFGNKKHITCRKFDNDHYKLLSTPTPSGPFDTPWKRKAKKTVTNSNNAPLAFAALEASGSYIFHLVMYCRRLRGTFTPSTTFLYRHISGRVNNNKLPLIAGPEKYDSASTLTHPLSTSAPAL